MKTFYLYKTVNLVNGKEYIGVHNGELDDDYLGSGVLLKQAIEKYGRSSFRKEIIEVFEEREMAFKKEKELVTEEYINTGKTYNLAAGGCGGDLRKGQKQSEESRKKISIAAKLRNETPEFKKMLSETHKGKKISEEMKKAISKKLKGTKRVFTKEHISNMSGEKNSMFGRTHSEESKKITSEKNKVLRWTWNPSTGEQKRRHKDEILPENWIYGRRIKPSSISEEGLAKYAAWASPE